MITITLARAIFFKPYLTSAQEPRDVYFEEIYGGVGEAVTLTTDAAVPVTVTLVGYELSSH